MVKIVVREFGDVKERSIRKVLEIMNDCYNRIGTLAVEIVDIYFFDKPSAMNAFINEEKRKLGIGTSAFEESFFAVHDAWRGTPRIMIALDRMLALPRLVRIGGLRHEVGHTVLHGSLEYYTFSVPTSLLRLGRKGTISRQTMQDLLHLASIAVKDYEVTRLLYGNGFLEDQVAYCKYFLEPSEEEHEAWKLAKKNKAARFLVLVSVLKTACCAAPLLKDERYGEETTESIARSMSYLPVGFSANLSKILEVSSKFGENTHENVDLFMKKIVDELFVKNDLWADPES